MNWEMMQHMKIITLGSLFALSLAPLSCTNDDPCGPGFELDRNFCIVENIGGDSGEMTPEPPGDIFGKVCTSDDDCEDPAPNCGIRPGQTEGTCTILGCDTESLICPIGWECFALADACIEE